jgi:hypothetical protein
MSVCLSDTQLKSTRWLCSAVSYVSGLHCIEALWKHVLMGISVAVACPASRFSHINYTTTQILQRRWTSGTTQPQVPRRQKNILRPPTLGVKSPSLAVSEARPMGVAEYAV